MCGIFGMWQPRMKPETRDQVLRDGIALVRHRGPDSFGFSTGPDHGFAHARLSIIDINGGHQPVTNEDGNVIVVANNEIYNFLELRTELAALGHTFRTRSDTEVIAHAWEQWEEDCFGRFDGMFAIALVDRRKRRCVLARDGIGIKPLHFTRTPSGFAFASEIKSFYALPDFKPAPDRDALHLFLNFRYVPNEQTLFSGVERLEPGAILVLDADGRSDKRRFFSLAHVARRPPVPLPALEDELADALEQSVKAHLISDVEVATYLSGGVDSSIVTACAARHSPGIRSFCVAFGEPSDENADARRVAALTGSKHEDIVVPDEVLSHMGEVMWHVEEPKVNALQGYVLAGVVGKRVRVALSGLGGDELFAGYTNNDILYPMTLLTRLFGASATRLSMGALQRLFGSSRLDLAFRAGELGLRARDPLGFYCVLRNAFDHNPTLLTRLYGDYPSHWRELSREALRPYYESEDPDVLGALLLLEARTKMVNDFLLTEDRVSMANSLETRVPLLSRRLLTLAFGLPSQLRYRPRGKKWLMKRAALRWLPREVLEKKKWGFSFNPYLLFQKSLRAFAAQELTRERMEQLDFVRWDWVKSVLEAPASPSMRWHYFNLWALVGLSIWHRRFFETPVAAPQIEDGARASGT